MLTVAEALDQILQQVQALPAEQVGLWECLGRVLAEDVVSPRDLPPHAVSQMDGYAVRGADLATPGATLTVVGAAFAGDGTTTAIGPGQAARIMTGAPVPEGADTVVMQEEATREDDSVTFKRAAAKGEFVRARGADQSRGTRALPAGTLLGPPHVALLASIGRSQLKVTQRPRVGVLSTGDELCDLDELHGGTQRIVDSNTWAIGAQVIAAGGIPVRLGRAADDPAAIERALKGAGHCDVVLTSAGASVGERDYVREVLARRGVELAFWRVAMKPGKPVAFGARGEQLYFALPGNPTSAMVSFEQFVRPALLKLAGRRLLTRPLLQARLEAPLTKKAGLVHFVRARAHLEDGLVVVKPVSRQDSGLISSMAEANALIALPAELETAPAGATVKVQLLDAFEG